MRTIEWNERNHTLELIDQNNLPAVYRKVSLKSYQEVIDAIYTMVVRGAPAIGVSAAYGIAMAALQYSQQDIEGFKSYLHNVAQELGASRPTAVNLWTMLRRAMQLVDSHTGNADDLREDLLQLAHQLADEDVAINIAIAKHGAELIDDGDHIVHHCNTGALATVDYGTALGVIRMAHEQGKRIHVYVDETRPRLQGARLTAWELSQYGIPYDIISDSSSGHLMRIGKVNKVFYGADRVAMNGDVANKIGSYMLALAAVDNQIPVYSVFPTSTIDPNCSNGDEIEIEQRDAKEVLDISLAGHQVVPEGATAVNYAFDVTPHRLLSGLVTEKGVITPLFSEKLQKIMQKG